MPPVTAQLKKLRQSALPRLSVRAMAELLEMPFGTYAFYESASTFKKPHLPLEFARKVAAVLARHGVDPAEVMKLAGLTADEAQPEAETIAAQRPPVQHVMMPVAFPSEDALYQMFRGLLALAPEDSSKDEVAKILARRLPSGFAAIGPLAPELGNSVVPERAEAPQSPGTVRRATPRQSRT